MRYGAIAAGELHFLPAYANLIDEQPQVFLGERSVLQEFRSDCLREGVDVFLLQQIRRQSGLAFYAGNFRLDRLTLACSVSVRSRSVSSSLMSPFSMPS